MECTIQEETPSRLTRAIKSMFQSVEGIVRINGKSSLPFNLGKSVKQGGSLSPLLFIIFMDEVLKTCEARTNNGNEKA